MPTLIFTSYILNANKTFLLKIVESIFKLQYRMTHSQQEQRWKFFTSDDVFMKTFEL